MIVFIHGGGLVSGSANSFIGDWLARTGPAVIVTIQYRLGALGFLAQAGPSSSSSANVGLLDQLAALRWIHDNVQDFGGDADHVLVWGISAGSASAETLLTTGAADGLAQAAILESGFFSRLPTRATSKNYAQMVAKLDCGSEPDPVECMRARSVASVVAAGSSLQWSPVIDGRTITIQPLQAIRNGALSVPCLIGTSAHEFWPASIKHLSPQIDSVLAALDNPRHVNDYGNAVLPWIGGSSLSDFLQVYRPEASESPQAAFATAVGDRLCTCPANEVARHASSHTRVWRYIYDHSFESPDWHTSGAFHGADIFLLSHHLPSSLKLSSAENALSVRLVRYWTRLAKNGDPNGGDDPVWPDYDAETRAVVLNTELTEVRNYRASECDLWVKADMR